MLGILILSKHIQKELQERIKSLLMILIMMGLSFLSEKKILVKLNRKTTFALMCFVTEIDRFFQFTFQIKNLNIQ